MNQPLAYMDLYNEFMKKYKISEVSGEEVGLLIAQLAQHFGEFNLELAKAQRKLMVVAQDIESRVDDNGKTISSAKASVFTSATPEYGVVDELKTHLNNCDVFLSALKALQKGILNEYQHLANT